MRTLRHAFACLSVNLLAAASLSAGTLTLVNPSFEASAGFNGGNPGTIPGWNSAAFGGTFGQVENDTTLFTAGLSGNNATYLNGGITQTVAATYVTGATYTVTVDIGNPLTLAATAASLSFGFRNPANNAFLASGFVSTAAEDAVPDGTFQTFSTTYTALASDNGNPITIGMTDFFSGDSNYRLDNVTLSSSVPEPSTCVSVLASSICAIACMRQRKQRCA